MTDPETPAAIVNAGGALEFQARILDDVAGFGATLLAYIGDRLGLFRDLAAEGPSTSSELAARTGTSERYVREWLGAMVCADYLAYEPGSRTFALSPGARAVLADETGPFFTVGFQQMLAGLTRSLPAVVEAFKAGDGVAQSSYNGDVWCGMDRLAAGWVRHALLEQWLPAMPDLGAALERGARVADVGCGRGRAVVRLAKAFPVSNFVGYDVFEPALAHAVDHARAEGVADRVRFELLDVCDGLPERYDVVTAFDVVHDSADPLGLLRAVGESLPDKGIFVCLEMSCSDRLEDNAGTVGTILSTVSLLYCMPSSLAASGAGLGAISLPEARLRELCADAGLSRFRRVPVDNLFGTLYEAGR
jgi:SAM-dependent methyltransferase